MHSPLKQIVDRKKAVYSIAETDSALSAAKKMAEHRVGSLLVVDGDGKLIGIVTERDFLFKLVASEKDSKSLQVKEIMSKNLLTMNHHNTAQEALKLMTEKRIRHLPVYDDENQFLGLLSIGDLTKWASSRYHVKHDEVNDLVKYIQQ